MPPGGMLPSELRCTGLYGDWNARRLACGVAPYQPAYESWSDGAVRQRWFSLPEGTSVDATQPDAFRFPIGAQFWEEFRVLDGHSTKLVETRLLRKIATPKVSWAYTSYVWDAEAKAALQTNDGVTGVLGVRGSEAQMPPLGSREVDRAGLELVRAFIDD